MLIAPPVVPRPANDEPGPRRISICSVKKFSRTLTPESRTPSMKMSLRASKPRMKKRSPKALPPSPVPSVTPAVFRIACFKRRGVFVRQHFLAEHGDGLRRVQQRFGKFARRLQVIDLVGRGRIRIGIAVRGCRRAGVGKRHRRGLRSAGSGAPRDAGHCARGSDPASAWRQPDAGERPEHRPSPAGAVACCASAPENRWPPPSGQRPPKPCVRNNCRIFRRPSSSPRSNAATSASLPCSLKHAPKPNSICSSTPSR